MLVPPGSPEGPCVDAARDSLYCPQESMIPRPAPRGYPPTPKPRSGIYAFPMHKFVCVLNPYFKFVASIFE